MLKKIACLVKTIAVIKKYSEIKTSAIYYMSTTTNLTFTIAIFYLLIRESKILEKLSNVSR